MGFAYSFMNSKSFVNCFAGNHEYFEKIAKKQHFWDAPPPPILS